MDFILDQYGVIGAVAAILLLHFGIRFTKHFQLEWRRNLIIALFWLCVILICWAIYELFLLIRFLGFYYLILNTLFLYRLYPIVISRETFENDNPYGLKLMDAVTIGTILNLFPLFLYLIVWLVETVFSFFGW